MSYRYQEYKTETQQMLNDAFENSPAARKKQVAATLKSLPGFQFPRKPDFVLDEAQGQVGLVDALAQDAHLVSRDKTEKRVYDYVMGLLLAANRHWSLVEAGGKKALYAKIKESHFNTKEIKLSEAQVEQLVSAVVRARERYLVDIAGLTKEWSKYVAPNDMMTAAAQYLMVRMGEAQAKHAIVFEGVPMSRGEKMMLRARSKPVGQARSGNKNGRKLSTKYVQPIVPITETGRSHGRGIEEWFRLIDCM